MKQYNQMYNVHVCKIGNFVHSNFNKFKIKNYKIR